MKRIYLNAGWVVLLLLCLLSLEALAQSGGPYILEWSTIDGGGQSSGGPYILRGTTGQPDAGYLGGGNSMSCLAASWSEGHYV